MIETINKVSKVNFGERTAFSSFSSTPRPRPSYDRPRPSHLAATTGLLLPPPPAVQRVPVSPVTTKDPARVWIDRSPLSPARHRLYDWPTIHVAGSPESQNDRQGGAVVGRVDVPCQSPDGSTIAIDECYVNDVGRTAFDHHRLAVARNRVTSGGFYHGPLTASEARRLLTDRPVGTFLLRDSSDRVRYPFAVTVKIASMDSTSASAVTSIRIVYEAGRFRFDGVPESVERLPAFDCVVELIRYHMEDSKRRASFEGSRDGVRSAGVIAFVGRTAVQGKSTTETTPLPVALERPLPVCNAPSTLKHMCRRSVSSLLGDRSVSRLHLPPSLRQYLLDYPYDV